MSLRNSIIEFLSGYKKIDKISKIRRLSRDAFEYVEAGRSASFQIELLLDSDIDRLIYVNTITHWHTALGDSLISDDERIFIAKKVKEYFKSIGINAEVKN